MVYLEKGMEAGVKYLNNHINKDGMFDYIYNPLLDYTESTYNILRHAGTMYSIYQVLFEMKYNIKSITIFEKGINYLKSRTQTLGNSNDAPIYILKGNTVKLGGPALFLLALTQHEKATSKKTNRLLMEKLASFIMWMQEPSGNFRTEFIPDTVEFPRSISLYYAGEAILSLLSLYKLDNNPIWLNSAEKGLNYLVNSHNAIANNENLPHDHWLTIALCIHFEIKRNNESRLHANKLVDSLLNSLNKKTCEDNIIDTDISIGRAATRAEALAQVILLEANMGNYIRAQFLMENLERIISFCMDFQYNASNSTIFKNPSRVIGGFRHSKNIPSIRIDYVQHALSAMLGLKKARQLMAN